MKLIVFDCDGTLVDGQHLILDAMQVACLTCQVSYPGDAAVRQIVGLSLLEAIEICHPRENQKTHLALKDAFISRFQELRQREEDEEPLYDGTRDMIESLYDEGFTLGIATGKSRRGLISSLNNHGLSDYFMTLNAGDDGPGKPHPSMLINAMNEVGAKPENTAMIGDTTYDIHMALAANVSAIGVSWGYHDRSRLLEAGAHHMLDHISQIRQVINETIL